MLVNWGCICLQSLSTYVIYQDAIILRKQLLLGNMKIYVSCSVSQTVASTVMFVSPCKLPPLFRDKCSLQKRYIFPFVLSYKYQQYIDYNLDHTEPNNELVNNNSASHVGVPLLCTQKGVLKILTFFVLLCVTSHGDVAVAVGGAIPEPPHGQYNGYFLSVDTAKFLWFLWVWLQ